MVGSGRHGEAWANGWARPQAYVQGVRIPILA